MVFQASKEERRGTLFTRLPVRARPGSMSSRAAAANSSTNKGEKKRSWESSRVPLQNSEVPSSHPFGAEALIRKKKINFFLVKILEGVQNVLVLRIPAL